MPSLQAQVDLIRRTYAKAGLDPFETNYVEAHGTGTVAGDSVEAGGITEVFGMGRPSEAGPLFLGSVKTNIGHLENASGIAGLIKTILVLENGIIPPNLNFQTQKEGLSLNEWNFKVIQNNRTISAF